MPHVDADPLDDAIRRAVHAVVATSPDPPPLPTATVELATDPPRRILPRVLPALIAAAIVVALVASVSLVVVTRGGAAHSTAHPPAGAGWTRLPSDPNLGVQPRSLQVLTVGSDVLALTADSTPGGTGIVRGSSYSTSAHAWRPIAASPPGLQLFDSPVWTGRRVIVPGVFDSSGASRPGAAYDPATNRWSRIAAPPRRSSVASNGLYPGVWDGTEILFPGQALAYEPVADRWHDLAPDPLGERLYEVGVWTGSEVVVWGRCLTTCSAASDTSAYDPQTGRWHVLPRSPMVSRSGVRGVLAGGRVVLLGGYVPAGGVYASIYDPANERWEQLPAAPITRRARFAIAAVGNRVVVWGGRDAEGSVSLLRNDGAVLDVRSRRWSRMPTSLLSPREYPRATVVGRSVVIVGGDQAGPTASTLVPVVNDGARFSLTPSGRDQ